VGGRHLPAASRPLRGSLAAVGRIARIKARIHDDGARWRGAADDRNLDDFLTSLKNTTELTTTSGGIADVADYGLDAPQRRVQVEVTGDTPSGLAIGDRNPAGMAVYVRVGDGPVMLVGALLVWEFDKTFAAITGRPTPS
jgi:hypothetical protein